MDNQVDGVDQTQDQTQDQGSLAKEIEAAIRTLDQGLGTSPALAKLMLVGLGDVIDASGYSVGVYADGSIIVATGDGWWGASSIRRPRVFIDGVEIPIPTPNQADGSDQVDLIDQVDQVDDSDQVDKVDDSNQAGEVGEVGEVDKSNIPKSAGKAGEACRRILRLSAEGKVPKTSELLADLQPIAWMGSMVFSDGSAIQMMPGLFRVFGAGSLFGQAIGLSLRMANMVRKGEVPESLLS